MSPSAEMALVFANLYSMLALGQVMMGFMAVGRGGSWEEETSEVAVRQGSNDFTATTGVSLRNPNIRFVFAFTFLRRDLRRCSLSTGVKLRDPFSV